MFKISLYADHLLPNYHENTKYTNGLKFVDPRLAAVSPYFKESMTRLQNFIQMGEGVSIFACTTSRTDNICLLGYFSFFC